jgi:hypothetical protein
MAWVTSRTLAKVKSSARMARQPDVPNAIMDNLPSPEAIFEPFWKR